jgi:uncharacterized Ntn-hydrolase superfamily protein
LKTEADYIREHTARSKALKLEAWADAMVDEDPEVIRLRAKMWEVLDLLQSERKERTAKIQELTDKLRQSVRCAKIAEEYERQLQDWQDTHICGKIAAAIRTRP